MKSLAVFFISSMGAAVMNYVFQLVIARKLGGPEFSRFTLEWSYISIFFISGSFATYFSALNPLGRKIRAALYAGLQILALACLAGFFFGGLRWLSIGVVLENLLQCLLLGHYLGRGDYRNVNLLNLLVGGLRLAAALLLPENLLNLTGLFLTIFAAFFAVHVFYFLRPEKAAVAAAPGGRVNWTGPVILAVITGVLPQIDILWTARFLDAAALVQISELSLVSKAVFYTQLIVAQWLLPKDAREHQGRLRATYVKQILYVAGLLAASGLLGVTAYLVLPRLLDWKSGAGLESFVLISAVGTLTSVFFMTVQGLCKLNRIVGPLASFALLVTAAFGLGAAGVSLNVYLAGICGVYLACVVLLVNSRV